MGGHHRVRHAQQPARLHLSGSLEATSTHLSTGSWPLQASLSLTISTLAPTANISKKFPKSRNTPIGIKVFMGSSTGDLLIDDDPAWKRFSAWPVRRMMIVSVHAEDEATIRSNGKQIGAHGAILPPIRDTLGSSRRIAVKKALELSAKHQTGLCILHVSSTRGICLDPTGKSFGRAVFAEAAPHHLFLNTKAYETWGTRVHVNPPLREEEDQEALWSGNKRGHHTISSVQIMRPTLSKKKCREYGKAPSGIPSIELSASLDAQCRE